VTVAFAVTDESATIAAVTVCDPAAAGAVYMPPDVIFPTVELPPATPSTDHATVVFEMFCTVAVNCVLAPAARVTDDWFSVMVGVVEVEVALLPTPWQPASVKAIDNPSRLVKKFLFTETVLRTEIYLNLGPEIVADIWRELLRTTRSYRWSFGRVWLPTWIAIA
jgi:hypothetical protein